MICKRCGTENNETARFCRNCGNEFKQESIMTVSLDSNNQKYKKKTRKKSGVFLILILVIAGIIASFWITKSKKEKKIKEYKNQITQGNKYVEDLDYEKAEESYLKAIKVDPKRKDSYLKLADVYVAQEKYDKAIKILEDASENVTVTETKGKNKQDISKVKQEIENKKEEISNASEYTWVVKPGIEADDIYYLRDSNRREKSTNELQMQMKSKYAVIKKDDTYNLIELNGKITDLNEALNAFAGQENTKLSVGKVTTMDGFYCLKAAEGADNCIVNDQGKVMNCLDYDLTEEQGSYYYYNNGLCNAMAGMEYLNDQGITRNLRKIETTIPIKQSNNNYKTNREDADVWLEKNKTKYALWKDESLISDFIYDECGSENSGLLAVKKDGKWGYVDKTGKKIIPIEYDASWKEYFADLEQSIQKDYCYAASEGYVTLVKNNKWEVRTTDNKLVILPGIFEKILPVYDGKCWVKKDGKWGVIQLNESGMDKEDGNKNTVDNTESNTLLFTNAQIAYIRQQLSVPDSNNITMTISDSPYYWEAGGCSLVNVTFTENGEVVAGADVNVDTAECTTSIFNYTKTE